MPRSAAEHRLPITVHAPKILLLRDGIVVDFVMNNGKNSDANASSAIR